jgi:hypothetical protein
LLVLSWLLCLSGVPESYYEGQFQTSGALPQPAGRESPAGPATTALPPIPRLHVHFPQPIGAAPSHAALPGVHTRTGSRSAHYENLLLPDVPHDLPPLRLAQPPPAGEAAVTRGHGGSLRGLRGYPVQQGSIWGEQLQAPVQQPFHQPQQLPYHPSYESGLQQQQQQRQRRTAEPTAAVPLPYQMPAVALPPQQIEEQPQWPCPPVWPQHAQQLQPPLQQQCPASITGGADGTPEGVLLYEMGAGGILPAEPGKTDRKPMQTGRRARIKYGWTLAFVEVVRAQPLNKRVGSWDGPWCDWAPERAVSALHNHSVIMAWACNSPSVGFHGSQGAPI